MGRTQRALTSLIGAIPAAFLAYLLVMVLLQSADSLTTATYVIIGVTLLCAALVAFMPVGLLIFTGKKVTADDGNSKIVASKTARKEADDDEEEVEEVESADDIDEMATAGSSEELDAFEDSDADIMSDSDDAITSGSGSSLDEIEAIDFDDEEDEEEKPKKRKK